MASSSFRVTLACALLMQLLLCVGAETNTGAVDLNEAQAPAWNGAPSPMASIDCGSACTARCALASRVKVCRRACGSCCARCNCVPPGTAGNHGVCPCYAAITTHGGRRKCP